MAARATGSPARPGEILKRAGETFPAAFPSNQVSEWFPAALPYTPILSWSLCALLTEASRRSAIEADRKAVQPQSRETWKGALSERTNKMTSFESDLQWTYTLA